MKARRDWIIILALGAILEGFAVWVATRMDLRDGFLDFLAGYFAMFAVYLVAVYYVLHHCRNRKSSFGLVLLVATLLRLTFLFTTPVLSDDIYRYIWDGRVQREGISPYRYPPQAPQLQHLRDPTYEGINNKDIPTIYPPLMQAAFAASTAYSETTMWMKGVFVLTDLVLIGVLAWLLVAMGQNPLRALIYAWSPLVVVEVAGSGHNDVLALVLLLAAHAAIIRKQDALSICFLTLSGLAKVLGLVLTPLVARSVRPWAWLVLPLTCLLVTWPYRDAGIGAFRGLLAFGLRWRANDSLFHLLYHATGSLDTAKALAAGAFAALVAILLLRKTPPLRGCYLAIGALILLGTTVHPWYVIWILPYLAFYPSPAWLLLTGTVVLSYHAPFLTPHGEPWEEQMFFKILEYGPFYAVLGLSALKSGFKGQRYREKGMGRFRFKGDAEINS